MRLSDDYQPAAGLLNGRTILVSGASGAIGEACARRCAAHGACVVLLGRKVRRLEQIYDAIEQAGHPQPAIYPLDLEGATPADYAELADSLESAFGKLDGLLHAAGFLHGLTPLANFSAETWFRTLQINLNGPFLLSTALLKVMRRAGDASIVFLGDRVGDRGRAYWGGYGVAKAGLASLAKMLAAELEENTSIRVNTLDPGPVQSRLRLQAYPVADRDNWLRPDAVTDSILFLLGPDSLGVTGECFEYAAGAWSALGAGKTLVSKTPNDYRF